MDLGDLLAALLDLCSFVLRISHAVFKKARLQTFFLLTQFVGMLPLELQTLLQVVDLWLELFS